MWFRLQGRPEHPCSPQCAPPQGPSSALRRGHIGTDTVPAWLTLGEFVPEPQVARMFGGGFLNAVDQMKVAPSMLANVLDNMRPPAVRPIVQPTQKKEPEKPAEDRRTLCDPPPDLLLCDQP